jgi:hypothetical protein
VAGAWVGFNDNRVTMRSSYWGQGAHNALLVVGDTMQHAQKAGVVAANANFAAPHLKDQEKPLIDRMGDWWNSVFNGSPGSNEPAVAAVPEVQLPVVNMEPPVLEPPPKSTVTVEAPPLIQTTPVPSDSPVIADQPQRVPSFPRPLETTRPVDTIPGTRVYRTPDAMARMPDPAMPADVVRAPSQNARMTPYPGATDRGSATSSMGAAPAGNSAPRDSGSSTWTTPRESVLTPPPAATPGRDRADPAPTTSLRDGATYSGSASPSRDATYTAPSSASASASRESTSSASAGGASRSTRESASADSSGSGGSTRSASSAGESSSAPVGEATGSPSASTSESSQ